MEVIYEKSYNEYISWYALKHYAFFKKIAAFHRCSIKYLFWNLWTCSMFLVALQDVSFHHYQNWLLSRTFSIIFTSGFAITICKSPFLLLRPLKFKKEITEFCKKCRKIGKVPIYYLYLEINSSADNFKEVDLNH